MIIVYDYFLWHAETFVYFYVLLFSKCYAGQLCLVGIFVPFIFGILVRYLENGDSQKIHCNQESKETYENQLLADNQMEELSGSWFCPGCTLTLENESYHNHGIIVSGRTQNYHGLWQVIASDRLVDIRKSIIIKYFIAALNLSEATKVSITLKYEELSTGQIRYRELGSSTIRRRFFLFVRNAVHDSGHGLNVFHMSFRSS